MPVNFDMSSGATSLGTNSGKSFGGAALSGLGSALNGLFGQDFGLSAFGQGYENAVNREFSAEQNALNREFNSSEAQKARDYDERMANTVYQRAVADMKAAGINPVLALGSAGASSQSHGSASASYSDGGSAYSGNLPQSKNKKDALMPLLAMLAGAISGNPQMALVGLTRSFNRNGVMVNETRKYK
ncbi:DNA pilot protein [Dipodfec virus UOA04_Rod_618]|nr:DNA pilot protein [Dipodfec virus UOA04_Rod_618]